jgi:putative Mg2+ transporter-C (MgtC) family protein
MNPIGAVLLGLLVGYERSFHGRAAGMRTYGLVCMASAALTVIAGYAGLWYGGQATDSMSVDPTRVMQGIVTGIGFLGAGVIMKEGFSISGLNTAASIWASSAIGVMVGIGFYAAAILLAVLCALSMSLLYRLERRLPSKAASRSTCASKGISRPTKRHSDGCRNSEGTTSVAVRCPSSSATVIQSGTLSPWRATVAKEPAWPTWRR